MSFRSGPLAIAAFGLLLASPAPAAEFKIKNNDQPGEGFNDPTAATPVGGNPGTTVGAQRLRVFQEAARIWGGLLPSNVAIDVDGTFDSLPCDSTGAVLGSASTRTVHADFPGAPLPGTWYVQALANKLSGSDRDTTLSDLRARFNSDLGAPGCALTWYYGLDNQHGDKVDLLEVLLHEFGHGLGFLTVNDNATGAMLDGQPDAYLHHIYDTAQQQTWESMTLVRRKESAISGAISFIGPATTRFAGVTMRPRARVKVTAPAAVAGIYTIGTASFGAVLGADVSGSLVAALDGGASPTDACESLTNASALAGKIALIDRGTCNFTLKAKAVQDAGAIGAVIVNNTTGIINMSGDDLSITIPVVSVLQTDGARLRAALPATASIGVDPDLLSGADDQSRLRLYSPNPLESGSSVSHFDTTASPNLLMEPNISSDLTTNVDATMEVFKDLGWLRPQAPSGSGWILPASARAPGAGGAFYTTDLSIGNTAATTVAATLTFLGNGKDGRSGPTKDVLIPGRGVLTFVDVLQSAFGITGNDFGAIRITSVSPRLVALGQTSTPAASGGTFGQSVPAAAPADLVVYGSPRSIVGIREDALFRTNLIVANANESAIEVKLTLVTDDGRTLGPITLDPFQPLEMRQVGKVVEAFDGAGAVTSGTLILETPTVQGSFATYASVIDNKTNDPRTLLPNSEGPATWFLPASARAAGAGGAFYTTDLTIGNRGPRPATVTLKFAGNSQDGTGGAEKQVTVPAGQAKTFTDVLGSVFGLDADFGAIRVTGSNGALNVLGQTSTPGGGGTFGQSVPVSGPWDLVQVGSPRTIVGVREDASFRTNLIIANVTTVPVEVDLEFRDASGARVGGQRESFLPLEMRQLGKVLAGVPGTPVSIILSMPTSNGRVAAYASVIDNTTNDPRTLLPR